MGCHDTVVGQTSTVGDFHAKAYEWKVSDANNFRSAPPSLRSGQFYLEGTPYGLECLRQQNPWSLIGPIGGAVGKFKWRSGAQMGDGNSNGGG